MRRYENGSRVNGSAAKGGLRYEPERETNGMDAVVLPGVSHRMPAGERGALPDPGKSTQGSHLVECLRRRLTHFLAPITRCFLN